MKKSNFRDKVDGEIKIRQSGGVAGQISADDRNRVSIGIEVS